MHDSNNPAYVQVAKDVDAHHHMIVDEINKRLMPTTQMEGQRSMLIFSSTEEEIIKFRNSSYFGKHKAERQVLTELSASRREDREHLITRATRQGAVTLSARMYGRGTDFKINDQRVEKAGGMHVIQTFFSPDLSEEVKIIGRSARQGDIGSYSLVLLSKQEGLDVTKEAVEALRSDEVYKHLAKLGAQAGHAEVQSLRDMANGLLQELEILANSLKRLYRGEADHLNILLRRYNSPGGLNVGPRGIHVVLCLDESGSMAGPSWDELVRAFNAFWGATAATPWPNLFASVVQFGSTARITYQMQHILGHFPALVPRWSGTAFHPAVVEVEGLIHSHGPMNGYTAQYPGQFESHTVGFGSSAPRTLQSMAFANGQQDNKNYRKAAVGNLAEAFKAVAKSISPGRL
ncbi:MAG: hypothetical protein SGPRY_002493 [Prymnesium sp.]